MQALASLYGGGRKKPSPHPLTKRLEPKTDEKPHKISRRTCKREAIGESGGRDIWEKQRQVWKGKEKRSGERKREAAGRYQREKGRKSGGRNRGKKETDRVRKRQR